MKSLKAIVLCILFTGAASAQQTSPNLQFLLDEMAKRQFTACERVARKTFEFVGGENVRVNTAWIKETEGDSLKVTVINGSPGDMIVQEAEFRRVGRVCTATYTSIVQDAKSCTTYLTSNPIWKLEADTFGVLSAKNQGGVNLTMVPVANRCVLMYQISRAE